MKFCYNLKLKLWSCNNVIVQTSETRKPNLLDGIEIELTSFQVKTNCRSKFKFPMSSYLHTSLLGRGRTSHALWDKSHGNGVPPPTDIRPET